MANLVYITGNLVRKNEIKDAGATKVLKNTLAVRREMSKEKESDFINVTAFGKTAELINKYTTMGSKVGIQGRIQTGSYEGKNGKVYTTDVIIDKIELLDTRKREEAKEVEKSLDEINDDDLPF